MKRLISWFTRQKEKEEIESLQRLCDSILDRHDQNYSYMSWCPRRGEFIAVRGNEVLASNNGMYWRKILKRVDLLEEVESHEKTSYAKNS